MGTPQQPLLSAALSSGQPMGGEQGGWEQGTGQRHGGGLPCPPRAGAREGTASPRGAGGSEPQSWLQGGSGWGPGLGREAAGPRGVGRAGHLPPRGRTQLCASVGHTVGRPEAKGSAPRSQWAGSPRTAESPHGRPPAHPEPAPKESRPHRPGAGALVGLLALEIFSSGPHLFTPVARPSLAGQPQAPCVGAGEINPL